jgi:hypothetical protein
MRIGLRDLQRTAGLEGLDLVTRPAGKAMLAALRGYLGDVKSAEPLILDFKDIRVMDVSFADEFLVPLLRGENGEMAVCLEGASEEALFNIDTRLNMVDLCCLVRTDDGYELVGALDPVLRKVFSWLTKRKGATARDLSGQLHFSINAASNHLKRLFDRRTVVREEQMTKEGRQFVYRLPA